MNDHKILDVKEAEIGVYVVTGIIRVGWDKDIDPTYEVVNMSIFYGQFTTESVPSEIRRKGDSAVVTHHEFVQSATVAVWAYRLALSRLSVADEAG